MPEMTYHEYRLLQAQNKRIADLTAEIEEQARLLGMSGEREARLLAKIERLEAKANQDQSAIEGAALHIQSMKAEIEQLKGEIADWRTDRDQLRQAVEERNQTIRLQDAEIERQRKRLTDAETFMDRNVVIHWRRHLIDSGVQVGVVEDSPYWNDNDNDGVPR